MLNKLHNDPVTTGWRNHIIFILFILMMAALFVSRVLLSAGMIVFVLVSFFHKDTRSHFRNFFSSPLLWGMSLLFVLPFASGLWSADKEQWLDIIRIKLPLLVLPLAFAGPVSFSKKQWEWLAFVFLALMITATVWSMLHYVSDIKAVNESYLKAKTMVTPLGNDHVRFSWLVAVAVLLAGWLGWQKRNTKNVFGWILFIAAIWLIIFLHILAARTGLFSFYIILLGVVAWLIFTKAKLLQASLLLFLLILLPVGAYLLLPSFHNRVKFIRYDFTYFKEAHYLPGATDAVRVISLRAGWSVMDENPVSGVGFGDILTATQKQYAIHYPQMLETDKILPGSEWLLYGSGCGWPGFLLFTFCMLIPFVIKIPGKLVWWLLNATAAFSFLFDIGLEVQFGVFAYSFIILWWYKWIMSDTKEPHA